LIPEEGSYEIVRLANGSASVRSATAAETFHLVAGPVIEAETLYVRQLQLCERIAKCADEFCIWDVGLGAAANPVVALGCTAAIDARVRIISFDRTTRALEFALDHASELGYLAGFERELRALLAESHVEFARGAQHVRWEFNGGDFPQRMEAACALLDRGQRLLVAPHAIFFDAFSPARNPEMWTLPLLENLHALLDPQRPCTLATFSRSTIARTALLLAGFFVGRGDALAGKEETTVAANRHELLASPLDRAWLERARRSHAAEPLQQPIHRQEPLSDATWKTLRAHPQFV